MFSTRAALKVARTLVAGVVVFCAAGPALAQDAAQDASFLNFFRKTEVSGFVDFYYTYNFNKPAKPCATVAGVAVFSINIVAFQLLPSGTSGL